MKTKHLFNIHAILTQGFLRKLSLLKFSNMYLAMALLLVSRVVFKNITDWVGFKTTEIYCLTVLEVKCSKSRWLAGPCSFWILQWSSFAPPSSFWWLTKASLMFPGLQLHKFHLLVFLSQGVVVFVCLWLLTRLCSDGHQSCWTGGPLMPEWSQHNFTSFICGVVTLGGAWLKHQYYFVGRHTSHRKSPQKCNGKDLHFNTYFHRRRVEPLFSPKHFYVYLGHFSL